MKKLPSSVVEELMNDQDFLSLDDAGQDEILGQIQKKMGIQEPSENILQRAAKSVWNVSQPNMGMTANPNFPFLPSSGPDTNRMADEGMDLSMQQVEKSGHPFAAKAIPVASNLLAGAVLGGPMAAKGAKAVGGIAEKGLQKGKQIFTSGRDLKQVETELGNIEKSIGSSEANRILTKENLSREALSQSQKNKAKISTTARKNTEIYGQNLDEMEERLAQSGKIPDRKSYLDNVISKTVAEAEEMGLPSESPVMGKLRSFQRKFSPAEETADEGLAKTDLLGLPVRIEKSLEEPIKMSFNDLKNIKNSIFGKSSSPLRKGISYATPKDKVAELFLKNHGEFLGGLDEEIGLMNSEFAPYARARSFGYKSFKPNVPEETQRGANILQKSAIKGKSNADDLSYLDRLEKGSGRFSGTGDLRGRTPQLGEQLSKIDEQIKTLESSRGNILQKQAKLKELKSIRNKIIATGTGIVGGTTTIKLLSD